VVKIKNSEDLRSYMLDMMEDLRTGDISVEEAGVAGKLCEGVISSLKVEMQYAHMVGLQPRLPFLENKRTIELKQIEKRGK
jgi:hypothetical protein